MEIYGTSKDPEKDIRKIQSRLDPAEAWYSHTGKDALAHLFRVASGLDAMVVGESQIMGQLKKAFQMAKEKGFAGSCLDHFVNHALNVARRIRKETEIGRKPVSIASVAIDLIKKHLGIIRDKRCLVIGSGEMGALVVKQLVGKGLSCIKIINRTFEHAQALAEHAGGIALPWKDLNNALISSDIVVACAGSDKYIITKETLCDTMIERNKMPLAVIDLAVPRAVEPQASQLDDISLITIDSLKKQAAENLKSRLNQVHAAEIIVEEEAGL